jgi:nucleoside-diphosphate-sugar epimerase
MTILITGGTGFVGSWMQRKQPYGARARYWNGIEYNSPPYILPDNITHIVHLAPVAPTQMIGLAKNHGARLLYCSSGAVYHGETEYARNKRRWEQQCLDSGLDVVIARLFTFFGDGLDDGKAIRHMFQSARAGVPLVAYKNVTRSYMHGRELGRVMWEILFNGESGHCYDVGSSRPVTMTRLAHRISRFTGALVKVADAQVPSPVYLPNEERLWKYGLS